MVFIRTWLLLLLVIRAGMASAEFKASGFVAAEARLFTESAQYPEQFNDDAYSFILQPEFRYEMGAHRITFIPFGRVDSVDDERSHADVRELNWRVLKPDWEILVGVNRVFWGVMESRHLVDIINQLDLLEDIDGEEKFGQPMLQYTSLTDWGTFDFYVLPGFRERLYPGEKGRLRPALPVDADNAIYESDKENENIDYSFRYSQILGNWDVGMYYFNGTSREPRFQINADNSKFIPVYDLIDQYGMDIQYTGDAWLWKSEALYRAGQGNSFSALSLGFEYTLYQLLSSRSDLGFLIEYHYDGRDETAAPTYYDKNVFLGSRLAFNDVQDSSILAGVTFDENGQDVFYNIEAERRLGDNFKLDLRARLFANPKTGSFLSTISQDDYVQLQLRYYF